ncbi:hypothetical protein LZD49_28530 [Dyadobacter sp. CY261]|uniref:hypothetical protein n=1 Tax=Dyadobacter sp. CY261 TaxID=2907203 RepID=UPI001F2D1FE1|nr:hypothetical protein [Dyadobacter sp. CY261]MCF0074465.1 hypothetical protein [Dyadobacter sp. CY261]
MKHSFKFDGIVRYVNAAESPFKQVVFNAECEIICAINENSFVDFDADRIKEVIDDHEKSEGASYFI